MIGTVVLLFGFVESRLLNMLIFRVNLLFLLSFDHRDVVSLSYWPVVVWWIVRMASDFVNHRCQWLWQVDAFREDLVWFLKTSFWFFARCFNLGKGLVKWVALSHVWSPATYGPSLDYGFSTCVREQIWVQFLVDLRNWADATTLALWMA